MAITNTYVLLEKKTIASSTASLTFTGISQLYTDLVLVADFIMTSNARVDIRVGNGTLDSGSNYGWTTFWANSGGRSSYQGASSTTIQGPWDSGGTGTGQCQTIINFQNYRVTSTYRTIAGEFASANAVGGFAGVWMNTAGAIDTIQLLPTSNFSAGTYSLYGIGSVAAVTGTAKASGGTISYDSFGNVYHAFTATGSFIPSSAITGAEILVVGAGGGAYGSGNRTGGGGAGGLVYNSSVSFASGTTYTATVGSGGAAGSNGGNSNVTGGALSLTAALGGGFGGSSGAGAGADGGCGGGGGSAYGNGGSSTQTGGLGNVGGPGGSNVGGGGGGVGRRGGFGEIGEDGISIGAGRGGYGGIGTDLYSSWGIATSTGELVAGARYYGGGGGGGSDIRDTPYQVAPGGYGGGGLSGAYSGYSSASGAANTGGGGGGSGGNPANNASGGSGIVIIKYVGIQEIKWEIIFFQKLFI